MTSAVGSNVTQHSSAWPNPACGQREGERASMTSLRPKPLLSSNWIFWNAFKRWLATKTQKSNQSLFCPYSPNCADFTNAAWETAGTFDSRRRSFKKKKWKQHFERSFPFVCLPLFQESSDARCQLSSSLVPVAIWVGVNTQHGPQKTDSTPGEGGQRWCNVDIFWNVQFKK